MCMMEIAKDTAKHADNIAKGLVFYCPTCGEEFTTAVENPTCEECGCELEQLTMSDWLESTWYNDRVTTSISEPDTVLAGAVMVAFGGPNVWISTEGYVEAISWGDYERAPIDGDTCDELLNVLQDAWDARRA